MEKRCINLQSQTLELSGIQGWKQVSILYPKDAAKQDTAIDDLFEQRN